MKNYKTSILGVFAIIAGGVALLLVFLDKATLTEAGSYLGLMLAFIVGVGAFLTKDHDKDNNEDVMADAGSIPGGGLKKDKP